MCFRITLTTFALCVLGALALTPAAESGGIKVIPITVTNDSAGVSLTTFWIGDSAGVGAKSDFDTSIVYDASRWDDLTIGVKSRPGCQPCLAVPAAAGDSGAVVVVLQMSNDKVYWTPIDSLVVVDSLPAFKDMALQKYWWARFIAHHSTKTDSSGIKAIISANAWGRY